jgi:hypothetical protein
MTCSNCGLNDCNNKCKNKTFKCTWCNGKHHVRACILVCHDDKCIISGQHAKHEQSVQLQKDVQPKVDISNREQKRIKKIENEQKKLEDEQKKLEDEQKRLKELKKLREEDVDLCETVSCGTYGIPRLPKLDYLPQLKKTLDELTSDDREKLLAFMLKISEYEYNYLKKNPEIIEMKNFFDEKIGWFSDGCIDSGCGQVLKRELEMYNISKMIKTNKNGEEYLSTNPSSIYDIIVEAFKQHRDVVLTLDAVVSQFFSIFETCEKNNIFEKNPKKEKIIVCVGGTLSEEKLKELPTHFAKKIDLKAFGLNQFVKTFQTVMSKVNLGACIFTLAGMAERYEYICHTMCKNPDITIKSTKEDVEMLLTIMKAFSTLKLNKGQKLPKEMSFFCTLIQKIYEKQFLDKIDEKFFLDLIQPGGASGGPVMGNILCLSATKSECSVSVLRGTYYLQYGAKIIIRKEGNILVHDVIATWPDVDAPV